MQNKLTQSEVYYGQGEISKKVADFINSLMLWENDACQLVISPATANIAVADAAAGMTVPVTLTMMSSEVTPTKLNFAEFTLAASIADTVDDSGTVPSIDDETPNMLDGEVVVTITLPEGTYVAEETVTLTISNYTAKDGRTITGGTCVLTIV